MTNPGCDLEAFVNSLDGFELAETDFSLRGPGDPLGTRQHGIPTLRMADLHRDQDVLQEARSVAQQLLTEPAALFEPEFELLRRKVEKRLEKGGKGGATACGKVVTGE